MVQHDMVALRGILDEAQGYAYLIRGIAYELDEKEAPPLGTVTLLETLKDAREQLIRLAAKTPS